MEKGLGKEPSCSEADGGTQKETTAGFSRERYNNNNLYLNCKIH